MRISIHETSEDAVIKIEGRVAGSWAAELGTAWTGLFSTLHSRQVFLDMCDVTYVDEAGMKILRQIYRESNAEFQSASPLTEYYAEQAQLEKEIDDLEEE